MTDQTELIRIMRLREQISGNPAEREIMKNAADEIERLSKQSVNYFKNCYNCDCCYENENCEYECGKFNICVDPETDGCSFYEDKILS